MGVADLVISRRKWWMSSARGVAIGEVFHSSTIADRDSPLFIRVSLNVGLSPTLASGSSPNLTMASWRGFHSVIRLHLSEGLEKDRQ